MILNETIYSFGEICLKDTLALSKGDENYKYNRSVPIGINQEKPYINSFLENNTCKNYQTK